MVTKLHFVKTKAFLNGPKKLLSAFGQKSQKFSILFIPLLLVLVLLLNIVKEPVYALTAAHDFDRTISDTHNTDTYKFLESPSEPIMYNDTDKTVDWYYGNGEFRDSTGDYNGKQYFDVSGMAVDQSNTVYLLQIYNDSGTLKNRIVKLQSHSEQVQATYNIGNVQLSTKAGLAFDNEGNIYVTDTSIQGVIKINPLTYAETDGVPTAGVTTFIAGAQAGGAIYYPQDVTIDINDRMYILQQSLDASDDPQPQLVVCDISDCAGTISFHATDSITNSEQIASDNRNVYIYASGGEGVWMYDNTYTHRATDFTGSGYRDVSFTKNVTSDKKIYLLNNDNSGTVKIEAYEPLTPANDDIANAQTISVPQIIHDSNLYATSESGEDVLAPDDPNGATVWYKYTASADQTVTFDTCQTPNENGQMYATIKLFDATVGTDFGDLALIEPTTKDVNSGSFMVCGSDGRSQTYDLTEGTEYYLRLRAGGNQQGNYVLNVSADAGPSNDNFLNAREFGGGNEFFGGDTTTATMETGESGDSGGKTVWFEALFNNTSGTIYFDTCSDTTSNFSWEMNLYTSATGDVADTTLVTPVSTVPCGDYQSTVRYAIAEHTRYYLQVRGEGTNAGPYQLNLVAQLKPVNDDFDDAYWLDGTDFTFDGNTNFGTMESGEPTAAGGKTVWYYTQASPARQVWIDSCSSNELLPELYVYTGSEVSSLDNVSVTTEACPEGSGSIYSFYQEADTQYNIQLRGSGSDSGYYNMHWELAAPTPTPTVTATVTPSPTPEPNLAQTGSGRYAIFTYDQGGNALEVMTDGNKTNSDQSAGEFPNTEDYWGIGFDQEYSYNRVVYTTGEMFSDGGWFTGGLKVQVKQSGEWVDVTGMTLFPSYQYNNYAGPYNTYTFTFDEISGDAIRVYGDTTTFTSVGELEIYDGEIPAITPANSPGSANLAQTGVGRYPIDVWDQNGNALGIMTDGNLDGSAQSQTNPATTKSEDYWGIGFNRLYDFNRVVYTTGADFYDGSWFASGLKVQVMQSGTWVDVSGTSISPEYPYDVSAYPYKSYTFTFNTISGEAIRVYGVPAERQPEYQFTAIAELEIYYDVTPSTTPSVTPTPTPVNTSLVSAVNIPASYVNMGDPKGMVMLPDGNIWYVDSFNHRIVLFNPNADSIIRTVGRLGSGEGEFQELITDITRDNSGDLYVIHASCMVYKLDPNGGFLGLYYLHDSDPNCDQTTSDSIQYDPYSDSLLITYKDKGTINKFSRDLNFISSFGGNGSADGEFYEPMSTTTDSNGLIYVADRRNNRIQVFSPTYAHIRTISGPWADIGGTTDFNWLTDIVVLSDGTITASNTTYGTIEQFSANGTHIRTWNNVYDSENPAYMRNPEFLVKDSTDHVYVGDTWIKSLSKYSSTGTFISTMRNTSMADGKFYFPTDFAYCPNNNLYVIDGNDGGHPRVQEFSNSGTWLHTILEIGDGALSNGSQYITCDASGHLWVSSNYDVRIFTKSGSTWTLTKTIAGHFEGDQGGGGLGGIAISGNDVYIPNIVDSDIMKYTLNTETGNYDYISSFGGGWDPNDRNADPQIPPQTGQLEYPYSVVIDSRGHFFVADWGSLKEFDETGTYVRNIGVAGTDFQSARGISIDPVNENLYLTDDWGYEVDVFDNISGAKLSMIGSPDSARMGSQYWAGSGQLQFFRPYNSKINPLTHTLTIADTENSRLQTMANGYRILNLISSADVVRNDNQGHNGESLSSQAWEPGSFTNAAAIPARLMFGNYVVADFTVNLTADRDWSAVSVQTLPWNSKALVVNLNQTTAPGISSNHSLYVYRYSNQTSVNVCPEATTLAEVIPDCAGEYTLNEGDSNLTALTISGKNYWKIDGLTGTGAFSSLFETAFGLKDLMTREQVDTASSHRLSFGTTYNLTHSGDMIIATFTSDWDLSSITVADLSLLNGSTVLNLDTAPDTDTWGVTIDNDAKTITFIAPTDGTGYITSGSSVYILINGTALVNPVDVGTYEIDLRIQSSDGGTGFNLETGSVNVPIVDSDQVDITSYVNNYIVFDIDTATTNTECGYDECLLHSGGGAAGNYTVDLGELNSTYVNKSQDVSTRHSDGLMGTINSIYLDLTSNAVNGTVVNVFSSNGGLVGPNSTIAAVADGNDITANSGLYGFTLPSGVTLHGGVTLNENCTTSYCGPTIEAKEVFNTDGAPVDTARVRMDLAAAAAYTDSPGNYTDTLTFVATGTF